MKCEPVHAATMTKVRLVTEAIH